MYKAIIISCLIVIGAVNMNAQSHIIKENRGGKLFNSSFNYMGYRPLYKDTLIIDLDKGQRIEFVYRWFDLFRCNRQAYNQYFWNNFLAKYTLLKDKLKELPLEDDRTYHITINTKRVRDYALQNAYHYRDEEETKKINAKYMGMKEQIQLLNNLKSTSYFNGEPEGNDSVDSKAHIDKIMQYFDGGLKRSSTISVTERKSYNSHKEYKLEGSKFIGQVQWQHILEVNNEDWRVNFYVNDLNDLSAFDMDKLSDFINSEKEHFINNRYYKYHTKLNYKLIDGEIKYQFQPGERKRKRTKYVALRLSPVIGTSITKGNLSADLGILTGLNFNDKQRAATSLALRYTLKGFGEENKIKYNGFVDAILDSNLADDYKREQWVGAGLGYLIHRDGSVYGKNTVRVFLKYRSSNLWGIQPEFNYSFDDNEGFVALGLFFSF